MERPLFLVKYCSTTTFGIRRTRYRRRLQVSGLPRSMTPGIFANRRTTASSPHFKTVATSRTVNSSDMRGVPLLPSRADQGVEPVLSGLRPRRVVLLGRLDAGVPEQFADLFHRNARCQPTTSSRVS